MILVDANVLLYAYHPRAEQHARCRGWVEKAFVGVEPAGLPWATILAFLRIGTNHRAFERPLTIVEATKIVAEWLTLPAVAVVDPGERYWEILGALLVEAQAAGPLVSDAAIAALALENGAALCTTDRDFRRFKGLRVVDPVSGSVGSSR
jgi:hypothetical protein